MDILVLNLISALLAIAATLIGVTKEDTWSKETKRPTKIGIIVIFLACLSTTIQASIKIIEWTNKMDFEKDLGRVYSGWISVGLYDKSTKKWDKSLLNGLESPDTIDDHVYIVKQQLNIRTKPPDDCPDKNNVWFGKETLTGTVLPPGGYVKIINSQLYDNCDKPGRIRVVAKIVLVPRS